MLTRQIEWLNANKYRSYPFKEDTTLTFITNNTVLDFSLIHYSLCNISAQFYSVKVLAGAPGVATFIFQFTGDGGDPSTVSFDVPENASFPYTVSAYLDGDVPGYATCIFGEDALNMFSKPDGTYMVPDLAYIEPSLLNGHCRLRVNSIVGGAVGSTPAKSDVYIAEGYNCQVTILPNSDTVRIAAIRGAGKGIVCNPPEDTPECSDVLLRVNGLHGDDSGNFMIYAGKGVSVIPDPENHVIVIKSGRQSQYDENQCGG